MSHTADESTDEFTYCGKHFSKNNSNGIKRRTLQDTVHSYTQQNRIDTSVKDRDKDQDIDDHFIDASQNQKQSEVFW